MKYRTLAAFRRDLDKLPTEHLIMFRDAVHKHFLPAIDAGASQDASPGHRGFASTGSATALSTP